MITEIIAAGAMGISVFFVVKAHSLLKDEQAKETPRPSILRQITIFMGFAILMTPIALGIEYLRHQMNLDNQEQNLDEARFSEKLKEIENRTLYSLNNDGNPEEIEIEFADVTYQLGTPYPESFFKDTHLKIKKGDNQRFLAVKENNSMDIIYGYFDAADINAVATSPEPVDPGPVQVVDQVLETEKLMATGLMYTPSSRTRNQVQQVIYRKKADENIANKYLVEFVNTQNLDRKLQELAVKILIQPTQMNSLDTLQYQKLINVLSADGPRKPPWRYYELAQVYLSRSIQQSSKQDRLKYLESLCRYKENYKAQRYMQRDTITYAVEQDWYRGALATLRSAKCNNACECR